MHLVGHRNHVLGTLGSNSADGGIRRRGIVIGVVRLPFLCDGGHTAPDGHLLARFLASPIGVSGSSDPRPRILRSCSGQSCAPRPFASARESAPILAGTCTSSPPWLRARQTTEPWLVAEYMVDAGFAHGPRDLFGPETYQSDIWAAPVIERRRSQGLHRRTAHMPLPAVRPEGALREVDATRSPRGY